MHYAVAGCLKRLGAEERHLCFAGMLAYLPPAAWGHPEIERSISETEPDSQRTAWHACQVASTLYWTTSASSDGFPTCVVQHHVLLLASETRRTVCGLRQAAAPVRMCLRPVGAVGKGSSWRVNTELVSLPGDSDVVLWSRHTAHSTRDTQLCTLLYAAEPFRLASIFFSKLSTCTYPLRKLKIRPHGICVFTSVGPSILFVVGLHFFWELECVNEQNLECLYIYIYIYIYINSSFVAAFQLGYRPPQSRGFYITHNYTHTHTLTGRTPLIEWSACGTGRHLTTNNKQQNILSFKGLTTRDPSMATTTDLRKHCVYAAYTLRIR